jgi:predicted TIM-barrel fold metal-dependent hydrolase
MKITDAQAHIWKPNSPARPWLPGVASHRAEPLGMEELLREMDAAGVSRCVLVPPTLDADRNDYCLEAAVAHPDRFGVMGRLDLEAPDARARIPRWLDQPGMLGLRFSFQRPWVGAALKEGRLEWLWEETEKAAIPIMMLLTHDMVHLLDPVAERHPGLRIVFDHLALETHAKDEQAFRGLDRLLALAKRPNCAVKASALPLYTSDPYPHRRLHVHLRKVYDRFGPKRMFWGSDLSRLKTPYRECVTMFTEEMPWIAPADLEWIMGRGLSEWIGWGG